MAQFIARHPIGTKPYLALCLLLFTGARSGDMVKLGRQHTWRGLLRFVPRKTKHVRMEISEKPILPPLAKAIEAGPTGDLTFLETQYRKPFTTKGFGNWFRNRCNEADLPHCTAQPCGEWGDHRAANGDLRLVHASPSGVYFRAANRTRLASQAMPLLAKWTEQESSIVAPNSPTLSHRS